MIKYRSAFFVLMLSILSLPGLAEAVKPSLPLELHFQETRRSEDKMEIALIAKSKLGTPSLTLSIDLPHDVHLVSGETRWVGPLQAGASHTLRITISNPNRPPLEIQGKSIMQLPNGAVFVQKRKLILNQPKGKHLKPLSPTRRKRNGRTILGFPGE